MNASRNGFWERCARASPKKSPSPQTHTRTRLARAHTPDGCLCAQIWGTIIIFWSFTVVQIIFQKLNPAHYWGTELIYCALSLSAKLYLGWFLMINVVMSNGAENALGGVRTEDHQDH